MLKWMNDDRFNENIQMDVLKLARVLAIEVKLTLRVHSEEFINIEKYQKKTQDGC